jgi:hypothetical protein
LLIAGGYLSYALNREGANAIPGVRMQTSNPEANVFEVTQSKGTIFFLFVSIALGSLIGMGATIAFIFWMLNRQVARAHLTEKSSKKAGSTT